MHLYRIDIYNLLADGSVGSIHSSEYADTPEKVLTIMDKWEAMTASTEADEDVPAVTYKAYKAVLKAAKYEDINIAQFKAMYR